MVVACAFTHSKPTWSTLWVLGHSYFRRFRLKSKHTYLYVHVCITYICKYMCDYICVYKTHTYFYMWKTCAGVHAHILSRQYSLTLTWWLDTYFFPLNFCWVLHCVQNHLECEEVTNPWKTYYLRHTLVCKHKHPPTFCILLQNYEGSKWDNTSAKAQLLP